MDQQNAGVNDLEDILKAYIADRMGVHGQRAAYRQLEGLRAVKKPKSMKCFEWEINYTGTGNTAVNWVPGPEDMMNDETLTRAYLETYPTKWIQDFEKVKTSDMANTTVSEITAYMTELETNAATAQKDNEAKQKAASAKKKNGNGKWPNHKKNRRTKHDRPTGSPKGGPKDDEQCRLHPDTPR